MSKLKSLGKAPLTTCNEDFSSMVYPDYVSLFAEQILEEIRDLKQLACFPKPSSLRNGGALLRFTKLRGGAKWHCLPRAYAKRDFSKTIDEMS